MTRHARHLPDALMIAGGLIVAASLAWFLHPAIALLLVGVEVFLVGVAFSVSRKGDS